MSSGSVESEHTEYTEFEKDYEEILEDYKQIIEEKYIKLNRNTILLYLHLHAHSIALGVSEKAERRKARLINIALFILSLVFQLPLFQVIRVSLLDTAWNAYKQRCGKWFKIIENYVKSIGKLLGKEYEYMLKDLFVELVNERGVGEYLRVKKAIERRLQKGELKLSDIPKWYREWLEEANRSLNSLAALIEPDLFNLYIQSCKFIYDKYEKSLEPLEKIFGRKTLLHRARCLALAWVGKDAEEKLWKPLDELFEKKNEKKRKAWEITKEFIKEVAYTVLRITQNEIAFELKYKDEFPLGLYEWILHPAVVAVIINLLYKEYRFKGLNNIQVLYEENGKVMTPKEYLNYLKQKYGVQNIGEILPKVLHRIFPELIIIMYVIGRYYGYFYAEERRRFRRKR